MKIDKIGISHTNFKANYFRIDKIGEYYQFCTVLTDNEENLGKEPVLQYEKNGNLKEFPMVYDGKYYTTEVVVKPNKYRIFYKDSGKYERNGEYQVINPLYYTKIATQYDRKYNNLPLENSIAKGNIEGKVFVNTFDIPKDVSAILVLDEIKNEEVLILKIPENIKGLITASADISVLDHTANLVRNKFNVLSVIWDDEKFNNLKKQEGKYLYINNEDGLLQYNEINHKKPANVNVNHISFTPESFTSESFTPKSFTPPKLENVEKLMTYDELTPQNCGNKGYRLSLIKKLIAKGQLKNIHLPQGFVIPEGYINKLKEYINMSDKEESEDRLFEGVYTQEVDNKVEELGMNPKDLIVRSNFNTEDMSNFSSAGIYDSSLNYDGYVLYTMLENVLKTQFSQKAKSVHKKYGIADNQIQPSVIVQDYIKHKYGFTVYSDDGNDNAIIQLSDFSKGCRRPEKAIIKYNKKAKDLTVVSKESSSARYLIDEKGNLADQYHDESAISENWKILTSLLSIVTSGALVLEKYFKHPQDIEGGITQDGKVYFWQTRDIVAKAVKRI